MQTIGNWKIKLGYFCSCLLTCSTQQKEAWVKQTIITPLHLGDLVIRAECAGGRAHDVHLLCANSPDYYLSYSHMGLTRHDTYVALGSW